MATVRRIWTTFAKGEWSPLLEGRPDLAGYAEAGKELTNWLLIRQGGVTRRPGLRYVREVKRSDKDTILFPFEYSVDDAYVIEVGETYKRFYKNRANILAFSGGPPVEVVTPYLEAQLRSVHFTQSADVMWLFHTNYQQRRLSRVSDTNWSLSPITYKPPPSFEVDTDISGGATLTPGAVTGTSVVFTASGAVFLEGDVGRLIIYGASRAVITGFGASAGDTTSPNDHVRADILDDFPDTVPPVGPDVLTGWKLRLSPQATLDPDKKEPVGSQVTLVAGTPTFRAADLGKYIVIYGGLIKITKFDSVTQVKGDLMSVMSVTDANPAAAPAGAWTLEEASWSGTHGFPRTGEFSQGRLVQASTQAQPTTFWMSASDDFDSYAIGTKADNAIEYTITSRKVNRIEWIADHSSLFLGTAGAEFKAESGKSDEPFGGDVIPVVKSTSREGSAPVQSIIIGGRLLFLDRSRKKIFDVAFNIEEDAFKASEVTSAAEHITGTGIKLGPIAFATRPDPHVYFVREDGQLAVLTFLVDEKVIGFTRFVTDGEFESVAVIPQPGGAPDQVWVIVKRTVGGRTVRYVEFFENEATDAVPGPDVFNESTGDGQAWFKGATVGPYPDTLGTEHAVPVFISDTTVFMFYRSYIALAVLRYRRSLDGGTTFGATEYSVTAETGADTITDVLCAEIVEDPDDLLPEHKVFIILNNATTNAVWVSRNVLQANPALATWSKYSLTGGTGGAGAPCCLTARGAQVIIVGQDGSTNIKTWCSNDFGITFPNIWSISSSITNPFGRQFAASPGVDKWVIINWNNGQVYRTIDNGITWSLVATLTGSGTAAYGCVLNVDDTIMVIIYMAAVYRSTDAGATWAQVADLAAAGGNIHTLGYHGNGIISGLADTVFTGTSVGEAAWRSEDYGLSWDTIPVDAGLNLGASRQIKKMAVRGVRAIVSASGPAGNGVSTYWYCPSTLVSTGPGESIDFADRLWTALQTDSAIVYVSATPTRSVPGLSHLEGETVEVVADGSYRGTKVVSMGSITTDEEYSKFEVGLHYESKGVTMRPTIPNMVTEGLPRSWNTLYLRLKDTVGGRLNGRPIAYKPSPLTTLVPFTGDHKVTGGSWDTEGRVTFEQTEPYPMTVLAIFGTLSVGDHD